jgi:hypothetical protein
VFALVAAILAIGVYLKAREAAETLNTWGLER